jgi:hypothetical protein
VYGGEGLAVKTYVLVSIPKRGPVGNSIVQAVEVEVNLRPAVNRKVCLGVRRPSGTRNQCIFLLEILRVCYFVAPSLTRGRVCNFNLQFILGLARAVTLGSSPAELNGHILLSHLRLPQSGGPSRRIYIPQEQGDPVISPGHRLQGKV